MERKNLKVILELKDSLSDNERKDALEYIGKWKAKFDIENLDENTLCKKGDNQKYSDDFGAVSIFYALLEEKNIFLKS